MHEYTDVTTRFLRPDERLILSAEEEMPLVIEAKKETRLNFLENFLTANSTEILADLTKYGAILLRGFEIATDEDFEKTILKINGFHGIREAFMAEEGRIHVGDLKYVLYTNAVYKTGGTLYLGGFHSENYYSPDVPNYICFCCMKPSIRGGETGLVNTVKIYETLSASLKEKLAKNTFFVGKWLLADVATRYDIAESLLEKICNYFSLPILGEGHNKFILMYKPSIFENSLTNKLALQINMFEIPTLNDELRKCFALDYSGSEWFWHRFVWSLPPFIFKAIEVIYVMFASFFYSPKDAFNNLVSKYKAYRANKKLPPYNKTKVGTCFNDDDVKNLAKSIRNFYCSCLWQKGDILVVDNRQVMHAGMPGSGPRLVRAMICNPMEMKYSALDSGSITCKTRDTDSIGFYTSVAKIPD